MPKLRRRWTREQCAPLESAGLFESERLELIDGELIVKTGKCRPHVNSLMLMLEWLQEVFGKRLVNAEAPIDVSPGDNPLNEPVPDLIVLNREYPSFKSGNPQPHDVRLIVEISDSTLSSIARQKPLSMPAPGSSNTGYWMSRDGV